jgi:glucose-1-phosphate cytidylyltransferase
VKAVILAGGLGSRLSEETTTKPKPMVEIGGRPILWHIMKSYSSHGINDFVICLGYKGYLIKEFFANYFLYSSDLTVDLASNKLEFHHNKCEPWRVTLVDTGAKTMTGGRLKRILPHVENEEAFCFTYGDGLTDLDIGKSIAFHKQHGLLATLTAVQPLGKFGALSIDANSRVSRFLEKPKGDGRWVNGGYFVLSPKVAQYLGGDETMWEREPLEQLSNAGQLAAYPHIGFWQPMDTIHDREVLEGLWRQGNAPWKGWE